MIKAAIFDLDGVIVDTAHYHYLAWSRLAKELGFELTEADNERLKGVSRMESLAIVLELAKVDVDEEERLRMAEKKNRWFVEYVSKMVPEEVFPGVKSLIADFRARGISIALASSSKNAGQVVDLLSIRHLFDAIVDGTMVAKSKPDPEIFLLASDLLKVPPENCLVFEDAAAGVEAARAAGMLCVGVGSAALLSHADLVVVRTGEFTMESLDKLTETL